LHVKAVDVKARSIKAVDIEAVKEGAAIGSKSIR